MDPADQFHSPYTYVGGDPVNLIDPDGRQAVAGPELQSQCPECPNLRQGVTITAERPANAGAFIHNHTLYYNLATQPGNQALYDQLRANAQHASDVIQSASASIEAQSIAMRAHIHNGQESAMVHGAFLASNVFGTASMLTGVGSLTGAGLMYFWHGLLKYATRQAVVRSTQTLSTVSMYAGGVDAALMGGLYFNGNARGQSVIAPVLGTMLGFGSGLRAFHGLQVTSHPGASFNGAGGFLPNSAGFGRHFGATAVGSSVSIFQFVETALD